MLKHPKVAAFVAIVIFFIFFGLKYFVPGTVGDAKPSQGSGEHKTLVVFGPPLHGSTEAPDLEKLVRSNYPSADLLIPTYSNTWLSNSDPIDITDVIERGIRDADDKYHYEKIILFGYSVGGLFLRKAYVWGQGFDDDREPRHPRLFRHPWVDRVDRFISLAAPNRGWPRDEKPRNLDPYLYNFAQFAVQAFRITGTGQLILSLEQGSPFVANMRVQWINLFHTKKFLDGHGPQIIHLIGNNDELVDREDSIDLEIGPQAIVKTLDGQKHDFATYIYEADGKQLSPAGEAIQIALTKARNEFPESWHEKIQMVQTDPRIRHLIFVMHGIRDESVWPSEIQRAVEEAVIAKDRRGIVVVLSDFYEEPETIVKTVEPLRYRGNEVILFHVLDPQEIAPKFREPVLLVDMEDAAHALEVSPEYARNEYRAQDRRAHRSAQLRSAPRRAWIIS